jgi:DNA end-binding protein Ku
MIRPVGDVLVLETLYFADEIRDPVELPNLSGHAGVKPKERDMAQALIKSLAEKWNPADYHDSYREHVTALLKDKQAGHETVTHAESERGGKVIDLLEALQASVKNAGGTSSRAAKSTTAKKSAKKTAGVKAAKKSAPRAKATNVSKSAKVSKKRSSGPSGSRRAS